MTDERKPRDTMPSDPDPEAADLPTPAPNAASPDSSAEAVGAYLLDALPDDERAAFEAFLATSPEAQAEARELATAVALLPRALASDRDIAAAPAPSAGLRDRILAAALAEREGARGEAVPAVPVIERLDPPAATDAPPIPIGARRPQGRIRGGVATPDTAAVPTIVSLTRRAPASWLAGAAAALTVVAVGAILWALLLQGRIDSKNREITSQRAEIAQLRQSTNATAYTLGSSETGGPNGTLLYSVKDQIGVLYVRELPPLAQDTVYQLWYLDTESPAPRPGGTFTVDANGNGFTLVAEDTPSFDGIALTQEPKGGSPAPTTPILLQGQLGGAAG